MDSGLIFGAVIAVVFVIVFALNAEKKGGSNNNDTAVSPSKEDKLKAVSPSKEDKLDKIYDVLNHIRWIGLSIASMFALTFIIPQCTGG